MNLIICAFSHWQFSFPLKLLNPLWHHHTIYIQNVTDFRLNGQYQGSSEIRASELNQLNQLPQNEVRLLIETVFSELKLLWSQYQLQGEGANFPYFRIHSKTPSSKVVRMSWATFLSEAGVCQGWEKLPEQVHQDEAMLTNVHAVRDDPCRNDSTYKMQSSL